MQRNLINVTERFACTISSDFVLKKSPSTLKITTVKFDLRSHSLLRKEKHNDLFNRSQEYVQSESGRQSRRCTDS